LQQHLWCHRTGVLRCLLVNVCSYQPVLDAHWICQCTGHSVGYWHLCTVMDYILRLYDGCLATHILGCVRCVLLPAVQLCAAHRFLLQPRPDSQTQPTQSRGVVWNHHCIRCMGTSCHVVYFSCASVYLHTLPSISIHTYICICICICIYFICIYFLFAWALLY
jgi:hypothetical protein